MKKGVFLRFDEAATQVLPSDSEGALEDLKNDDETTLPEVTAGIAGFAREFVAADATGLRAVDVTPGASLFTRTLSIQALVRWDIDDQDAAGTPGVIVCRGIRGSSSERIAYCLELYVVNAGARIGGVRWLWEDVDGNLTTATGGQFKLPTASAWMLLTAVRRWSPDGVAVAYYLGDQLLTEAVEADTDIGGGTTGTTTIGGRVTDGADAWTSHLDGAIDELRVLDTELVAEQVRSTWERINTTQALGEQLWRDCLPPGLPVSDHPDSSVQREFRLIGQGLGFAAAQGENLRANIMPDRAYGPVLERWEAITRQSPRPGDSVATRRARVLGHLGRHAGVSPVGVRAALEELLAIDGEDLELLAYDNTLRDAFDELVSTRWRLSPAADWSVAGGALVVEVDAAEEPYALDGWRTCLTGVDGPERAGGFGAQLFAKLDPTAIPDGGEVGLVLYDFPRKDALMLGLRRDGADYKVVSQRIIADVAQAAVVHATTSLAPHWLHLYAEPLEYDGQAPDELVAHAVRWSTTSATAGFSEGDPGDFSFAVGWCGFYARAWDGSPLGGSIDVAFDDAAFRFPNGIRPFHFYVLRDPDSPGDYDLKGANGTLRKLRQSHTHAAAITGPMLAGDPESGCGFGPCGGTP